MPGCPVPRAPCPVLGTPIEGLHAPFCRSSVPWIQQAARWLRLMLRRCRSSSWWDWLLCRAMVALSIEISAWRIYGKAKRDFGFVGGARRSEWKGHHRYEREESCLARVQLSRTVGLEARTGRSTERQRGGLLSLPRSCLSLTRAECGTYPSTTQVTSHS